MKNPRIPLAGVIGWPIAHSKSPRIHGHWLETNNISGHYIPLGIAPDDFESALQTLPKLGFLGANVTIPHKEMALALASRVTERAQAIGAANTLTFLPDGGFEADNTDGIGFINNLKQNAPEWQPNVGPALVLGAGGSCRAIIWSLLDAGVEKIILSNRSKDRAVQLAEDFGPKVGIVDWSEISAATMDAATIVNTTSLGMENQPELKIDLNCGSSTLVTDIVYAPLKTDLLVQALEKGLRTVDGLGMLLHQAAPGFEKWFGVRPTVNETLREIVLA